MAHAIAQTFLMFDKVWFNIANTICYGLCTLLISLFVGNRFSLSSWVVVLLSFWLIMPHPGSSIFWLTGSCNYLWSACLCIAYMHLLFTDNVKRQYFSLILAIPAGNSHEGIALGVFVCTCMYAILTKKRNFLFIISATIFLVGLLSNCIAPGNFVRLDGKNVADSFSFFTFAKSCVGEFIYAVREAKDLGLSFCGGAFVISIIWIAKHLYLHVRSGQKLQYKVVSLLPSVAVTFALCVYTNSVYPRALFGFCFFAYVALYGLISKLEYKHINLTLIVFAFILSGVEITKMIQSVSELRNFISYVSSEAKEKNIILSTLNWQKAKQSRYIERYGMGDCCISNRAFEKYHRILPFSVFDGEVYKELIPHLSDFKKSNVSI